MIAPTNAFKILLDLAIPLDSDISVIRSKLNDPAQQTMRRSFVRAALARIEALTFGLKRLTLERAADGILSTGEQAILKETSFHLKKNGKVRESQSFPPPPDNIRFTLSTLAKVLNLEYEMETGSRWDALRKSVKIRNRITHPKCPEDLIVSEQEIEFVDIAIKWFDAQFGAIAKLHRANAENASRTAGATDNDLKCISLLARKKLQDICEGKIE